MWNPNKQIDDKDQFYIVDNESNIIESQPTIEKATAAVKILNDHEVRCGRSVKYDYLRRWP